MLSRILRKKADDPVIAPHTPPERSERERMFVEANVTTRSRKEHTGIIVDISDTGACIRFVSNNGLAVGEVVKLIAPLKSIRRYCKMVWRDQNDVGMEFL